MAAVDGPTGRYRGVFDAASDGVYRLEVSASQGDLSLGSSTEWVFVGGVDAEFADPWANGDVLRRIADASGGQHLTGDGLEVLPGLILSQTEQRAPMTRELWHGLLTFLLVLTVLTAEWGLRRAWGMR